MDLTNAAEANLVIFRRLPKETIFTTTLYTKTEIRAVAFLFQNDKTRPNPFEVGRKDKL